MTSLDGKVAVITGGNRGIGKGIAKVLAAEGVKLAICGRSVDELERTAEELRADGADVLAQPTDVADEAAVKSLFAAVMERFGRVDILVNNAGAFDGGRLDEVSLEAWNTVIGACLTGTFLCSREAFPIMKEQHGGRILNIGSISAQRPRTGSTPYAAAKFGVSGMTQAIAIDGREFGIICSCLHPGNVRVERRQQQHPAPGDTDAIDVPDDEPMMATETIARAALAMLKLPDDVNFLEAIVLPRDQLYLERG